MTDKQPDILIFRDKDGKEYYGSQSLAKRLDNIEMLIGINLILWATYLIIKRDVLVKIVGRLV